MLDPELTVAQVLAAYPQASQVFIALDTDCVGCYLMSFCTLREVADQYQLSPEKILADLSVIAQNSTELEGTTHETSPQNPDLKHAARRGPGRVQRIPRRPGGLQHRPG